MSEDIALGKKPDSIDMLVGRKIRVHRLSRGISQEALADALGITFQQVQKYEKGTNRVGSGRLFRIAGLLEVPVSAFFEGAPPNGHAGGARPAQDLISEPQPYRLVHAFAKIGDPGVRNSIVDLVEKIARNPGLGGL